jgi:hypothetical protein
MKMTAILAAGGVLLSANSAWAQDVCMRPVEPAKVDGKTATMDQVLAVKALVMAFMSSSDTYQACVFDGLQAQQAAAKKNGATVEPAVVSDAQADINNNQAAKERVGKWFNQAVRDYKAAHPS